MCSVYLWLVVSWPKPMGFSNINHYHGSLIFLNDRTADLTLDHLLLYGVGASNMFPCVVAKTLWGNGWVVGGCHILPHVVWWIWMNLGLGRTELIFSVEKLRNSAVVSLAFSIKPTSSAKNRLRFCLFPFHAAKFSICVPRWIQIHLLRTALVFSLPPTVSSSHLATRELPLVEFDHPQGKRADGWMKTADGKYQKFGVHKAMKNDGGKCQVFLGWQICADDGIVKTTLP